MQNKYNLIKITLISLPIYFTNIFSANCQIIPDGTLPYNSTIKVENNTIFIEGGTQAGNNLFHSFKELSIPTNNTAFFNNTVDIKNIISRVTGGSISNIDGLIRANGSANLFLINPHGIIFGQNARLDIGGSFIVSTASSINFANGFEFNAINPATEPLLTISVPVELEFGGNPGAIIKVQGSGHTINSSQVYSPFNYSSFSNGLQVKSGNTLALIGGNILLEGGIISTQNGRIELQSLGQGSVKIDQINNQWIFSNIENQKITDIKLSSNALVFAESNNGTENSINIQANNIDILDGSLIVSQNLSYQNNSNYNRGIIVNNSGILKIQGESQLIASGVFTSNFGKTPGENIEINTNEIEIEGAQIATTTFNNASGGKIILNANSLKISGSTPSIVNTSGTGGINTFTYSSGNGGDIIGKVENLIVDNKGSLAAISSSRLLGQSGNVNITAENITLKNGSSLGSLAFGKGNGGDVLINASNSISVIGEALSLEPSLIQAATFGSGDAGNLEINTSALFVKDGGTVNTSTLAYGNAGNLIINAGNSIEVSGLGLNSKVPSSIASSADIVLDESLRTAYNLPESPTGNAGNLTLNSKNLNVTDDAVITVRNYGSGNAGTLQINADKISITNNGAVTATTAVGEGGDIEVNSKLLQLRFGNISATAGIQSTFGNGGNIDIATDILTATDKSSITANAFLGRGGNIRIDTQALVISADTQITASSQKGVNGTVEINAQNRNPGESKLRIGTVLEAPKIISNCQGRGSIAASKFVIIGTGTANPPRSLQDELFDNNGWHDNSSFVRATDNLDKSNFLSNELKPIVEAQAVVIEPSGDIHLVAPPNEVATVASPSDANSCYQNNGVTSENH